MPWLVGLFVLGLVIALTCSFITNARAIRRDINERFERVRVQLENEANTLLRDLLKDNRTS